MPNDHSECKCRECGVVYFDKPNKESIEDLGMCLSCDKLPSRIDLDDSEDDEFDL